MPATPLRSMNFLTRRAAVLPVLPGRRSACSTTRASRSTSSDDVDAEPPPQPDVARSKIATAADFLARPDPSMCTSWSTPRILHLETSSYAAFRAVRERDESCCERDRASAGSFPRGVAQSRGDAGHLEPVGDALLGQVLSITGDVRSPSSGRHRRPRRVLHSSWADRPSGNWDCRCSVLE